MKTSIILKILITIFDTLLLCAKFAVKACVLSVREFSDARKIGFANASV